ncbi:MAG TPA: hypothetical protein PLN33_19100 [Hyphomonadaceae bacterium]|nr:hypothetical protein [Hyphomonadaceae bacterium]
MSFSFLLRPAAISAALLSAVLIASCSPSTSEPQSAAASETTPASPAQSAGPNSVDEVVSAFKTALETKDYTAMLSLSMPDAVIAQIKQDAGLTTATTKQLRDQFAAAAAQTFQQATLLDVTIDAANAQVQTSGTGRQYALVPSSTLMEIQGERARSTNNYLAISEKGRWYLLNPSNAQVITVIKTVFPDLAEVALTEPHMEVISQ